MHDIIKLSTPFCYTFHFIYFLASFAYFLSRISSSKKKNIEQYINKEIDWREAAIFAFLGFLDSIDC